MPPAALPFIAAAGVGMAAVGFMEQRQGRKAIEQGNVQAAAAREREFAAQTQRAEIQNIRAVRQQIRQQRAAAASIIGRGATTGTLGSSGVAGGVGSTQSQLTSNLNYMSDVADTQTESIAASRDAGQAQLAVGQGQARVSEGAAWMSLGTTIFSQAGGFGEIFGKPPTTPNTTV